MVITVQKILITPESTQAKHKLYVNQYKIVKCTRKISFFTTQRDSSYLNQALIQPSQSSPTIL